MVVEFGMVPTLYGICVITVWEGDGMGVDDGSVQIVVSESRKKCATR